MLHAKRDVELLAHYAAGTIDLSPPPIANNLKTKITADKTTLTELDSAITLIKKRVSTSSEIHNKLLDRHNELVDEYERVRGRLNMAVDQYNALDVQYPVIIEIGGGINNEPLQVCHSTE